ncbi:hypothetical protein ACQUQU_14525 [Thalassolituus sp. LLYu03]
MKLYELGPEKEDLSENQMLHIHIAAALVSSLFLFIVAFIIIS